jgi:hypothetical protein
VDFHGVNVANATIIIQEILEKRKSLISQGGFLTTLHDSIPLSLALLSFLPMSCLSFTLVVAALCFFWN